MPMHHETTAKTAESFNAPADDWQDDYLALYDAERLSLRREDDEDAALQLPDWLDSDASQLPVARITVTHVNTIRSHFRASSGGAL